MATSVEIWMDRKPLVVLMSDFNEKKEMRRF